MKIEIKFTFPSNWQLHYVEGCVSWSSFDSTQTETVIRFFLFKFAYFDRIKSINETFWLRMIQSSFLFANITNLEEGKIIKLTSSTCFLSSNLYEIHETVSNGH